LLASVLLGLAGVSPAAEAMNDLLSAQTSFNIPAQPLGLSLKQLADQAGIQILFEEQVVSGLQAPAIKIRATALEALNTSSRARGSNLPRKTRRLRYVGNPQPPVPVRHQTSRVVLAD